MSDYRKLEGISKSGLQALYESVSSFKRYLYNTHNPFQPEHFTYGQLVEDMLVENVEQVNETYVVKDLKLPKADTLDATIFQLLLESNLKWNEIGDDFKVFVTEQAGMSSKYKTDYRLKKVNQLEDLYKDYESLFENKQYLVPTKTFDEAEAAVLAVKASQFRNLLDYDLAKVQLTREVDGITIKGELDWIIIDEENKSIQIIDLKTYGNRASKAGWLYQCLKFGYFEQAYNYVELVKINYPGYSVSFTFLVVDVANTVFIHNLSQDEYDIGKYGYTYVDGKPVVKAENKNPGFLIKFQNYKWYVDRFDNDVTLWPDEHPDLIKNKFIFNGVL